MQHTGHISYIFLSFSTPYQMRPKLALLDPVCHDVRGESFCHLLKAHILSCVTDFVTSFWGHWEAIFRADHLSNTSRTSLVLNPAAGWTCGLMIMCMFCMSYLCQYVEVYFPWFHFRYVLLHQVPRTEPVCNKKYLLPCQAQNLLFYCKQDCADGKSLESCWKQSKKSFDFNQMLLVPSYDLHIMERAINPWLTASNYLRAIFQIWKI